jgi:hypothetical protein
MFQITTDQYEKLVQKALYISKKNAYDIAHDAILKYSSFEECIMKMKFEKTKYNCVLEIDLNKNIENKVCIKCNQIHPISVFEVYIHGSFLSTKNICDDCNFKHRKAYNIANKDDINKRNRIRYKSDEKYRKKKDKTNSDWKKRNREHINQYQKEFREKNKERQLAYRKKYEESNKERILKKRREYIEKNKEKIMKKDKEWREKNKEILLEKRSSYEKKRRYKNY